MAVSKRPKRRATQRYRRPGFDPWAIDIRDGSGRFCARRAMEILGVSLPRLAGMVGCKPESLEKVALGPGIQRRLWQIERIIQILRPLCADDAAFQAWLCRRRKELGGKSPLDLLDERRTQLMVDIAEDIFVGNPS